MKTILIIIASLVIVLAKTPALPICNTDTAKQAIPPRIFYEQTIDGSSQNIILTRFLHNKLGILSSEFAKCYLNFLDPNFILNNFTIFGLIGTYYFIYRVLREKKFFLIILFAINPLVPFFKFPASIALVGSKIFAIIGLWFLRSKK